MPSFAPTHSDPAPPAVLAELATACLEVACPLADDLAGRLGLDVVTVWAELEALARAGLVEVWPDDPSGPSATLSGLMTARLGLVLADDGSRWITPAEAEKVRRAGRRPDDGNGVDLLDLLADPDSNRAEEAAIEREEHPI